MNKTNCPNDPYNIKLLKLSEVESFNSLKFNSSINISFETGTFLDLEKAAVVRATLKLGRDRDELSSYRPLYNTSILGKIIDKSCLLQLDVF